MKSDKSVEFPYTFFPSILLLFIFYKKHKVKNNVDLFGKPLQLGKKKTSLKKQKKCESFSFLSFLSGYVFFSGKKNIFILPG